MPPIRPLLPHSDFRRAPVAPLTRDGDAETYDRFLMRFSLAMFLENVNALC